MKCPAITKIFIEAWRSNEIKYKCKFCMGFYNISKTTCKCHLFPGKEISPDSVCRDYRPDESKIIYYYRHAIEENESKNFCDNCQSETINEIILSAHANAIEKGFWEKSQNISEKLMLIVTEIAEGAEAVRNDNIESVQPGSASLLEELADTVIRICDLCGYLNLDLDTAIRLKMEFNKTREYLHGKKF